MSDYGTWNGKTITEYKPGDLGYAYGGYPIRPHKVRPYKCTECGHEITTSTNHSGPIYPTCAGKCRQILNPHTAREVVLRKQTMHVCTLEDANEGIIEEKTES